MLSVLNKIKKNNKSGMLKKKRGDKLKNEGHTACLIILEVQGKEHYF